MRSSKMWIVSFVCAVLILGVSRGEFLKDPESCGRRKCVVPAERKFKYAEDVVYRYQYEVSSNANLGKPQEDTSEDAPGNEKESTLHIDATASIEFTSACEGYLRLANASISQNRSQYNNEFPDRAGAEFKSSLEKYPLRFAFDDGHILEVCPHPQDAIWVVNLKRGVLSMLQNTMKRFDVDRKVNELDVNGICDTHYKLQEARKTSLMIEKTKNIGTCIRRYKHLSIIQSNAYASPRLPSKPPPQPLLESSSECQITIDHNIYESVVCRDFQLLQPFSNGGKAGAQTHTTASLRLIEEHKEVASVQSDDLFHRREHHQERGDDKSFTPEKKSNLLYDHSDTPKPTHGELRTSRSLLKNMCSLDTNEELQQRFPEIFTKFIHSARVLNYPSLSQLLARANSICKNGGKHIIDALPFMGSNAAAMVMKDLIIKKRIARDRIDKWVTTFGMIPRPDRDLIWALGPLLDFQQEIPDAQFSLSYSALIHAYCVNHDSDCARLEPIVRFLAQLQKKIDSGCAPRLHSQSSLQETMEAIKAVGNAGLETTELLQSLLRCVDGSGGFVPMEVRLAAIEAHRRLPSCQLTRDRYFLDYYRNYTLDTELRIASYMQVMRCPDYNVVKTIKHTLKEEEVNQVGSFVWSHLTNLLNSASPTRVEIQSLLTDRDLGTKFNSDMRKFSRNYDNSFFSDEFDFGANYQGNLIFSPKSYIPRTAVLNATVDLFGESVNLFEIAVRMEGLETYAENLFGPDGPFSNEKVGNHVKQFLRKFRSAPDEHQEDYWKQVKRLPNLIDNNFDQPKISISYKVFGNELKYFVMDGDSEIRNTLASLNPWKKIKEILSGGEIRYENAAMFLDSSYIAPTTSGLPLRLALTGSAACNFRTSGSLDLERLTSHAELELLGKLIPSVSLDITGTMIIDGFYKSAGLKLRSNVYSSGAVQGHLEIKGARLARLDIGLPNQKVELLSVLTDVLLVHSNGPEVEEIPVGRLLTGEPDDNSKVQSKGNSKASHPHIISGTTCSWPALDRLIGLKMCAQYQFPNVTKNPNASYFILNGPSLIKLSLIKADRTAKSYLFEYKWQGSANGSVIRLAFDTPGSQLKRELSASVNLDVISKNITLLLRAAGSSLVAKGTYKRTEDEALVDMGLDVNGTKHLDAQFGYVRKESNYGYIYTPKLYLAINNECIANLSGTVRNAHKHNVSQCDIDLTFQTKRLQSHVMGYVMIRNMSIAGNIQLDYRLEGLPGSSAPKNESLLLEVSLIDRSSRTLTHKLANLKVQSSAYPQLNVVVKSWYQRALGHLELNTEINSSPYLEDDRHKLTAQLVLTYSKAYFQNQGAKISAFIAITKPIKNVDIKVGISHSSIGSDSNTRALVRYAPGKEVILLLTESTSRSPMLSMEAYVNLTIPNFMPMLIDARIHEKARHAYELDFSGRWFSGHNMTARGTYADRSNTNQINHMLKLLLKSPSFSRDILLYCKLYQDVTDLQIEMSFEELDMDKYAFVLNHTSQSLSRAMTYVEGRYKNSLYTAMTNIDTDREVRLELHLDRWRDIHFIARGINEPNKKEFGFDVKWDANRDPTLKLTTAVRFFKMADVVVAPSGEITILEKNATGSLTISYPGRLITGSCLLALKGYSNYVMDVRLDLSPDKTLQLGIDTEYKLQRELKFIKLETQLLTPFENWRRTSLNARYLLNETSLRAAGSAHWQDSSHVLLNLSANAIENVNSSDWDAQAEFHSSIHTIRDISLNFTHSQTYDNTADTRLLINYYPDKVIDAKSLWYLERPTDPKSEGFNLTGTLELKSPLNSYRHGQMKCQLRFMPNWQFQGAANLQIEKRRYTGQLIGDLAKLKESSVQLNLTTPLEKYSFVRARFGFSEKEKHVVAEILSPSGPIGFEALYRLFTESSDFHLKLLLATPIDVLQRSLLIAKLNKREADFRVGYNNVTVGFQGVWHYRNLTEFHYSYIFFTPLQGLEECGVVTKLLIARMPPRDDIKLDTEFSVRLAETKVGIKVSGGSKPPPIRILVKHPPVSSTVHDKSSTDEDDDEYEDEDEEEDIQDNLFWRGDLELNVAVIPAIIGALDIDEENSTYKILGSLKLPQGKIILDDKFFMDDVFTIRNDLSIETPFPCYSEITSIYGFIIVPENSKYFLEADVRVKNHDNWIEAGFNANYTYQKGEVDDSKIHTVQFTMKTPLKIIPFLNAKTIVEIDESTYKTILDIRADKCVIDLTASLELDQEYLDTAITLMIDSVPLKLPKTNIIIKKDFTDNEKRLDIDFKIDDPVSRVLNLHGIWNVKDLDHLKVSFTLNTWIDILRDIEVNVLCINTIMKDGYSRLTSNIKHYPNQEYRFLGEFKNGSISAELLSPLIHYGHLRFIGTIKKLNHDTSEQTYQVKGDIENRETSTVYEFESLVRVARTAELQALTSIEGKVAPKNGNKERSGNQLTFELREQKYGLTLDIKSQEFDGSASYSYTNNLNWETRAKVITSNQNSRMEYRLIALTNVQVDGNTTVYVDVATPWPELKSLITRLNMLLINETGNLQLTHRLNEESSEVSLSWTLLYMLNMSGRALVSYQTPDFSKHAVVQIFFDNPGRAFKSLNTGIDLNVDHEAWRFATNFTLGFHSLANVDAVISVKLPPPDNDDHKILCSYQANNGFQNASYVIGYTAVRARLNYASDGSIRMVSKDINGQLRITWGLLQNQTLNSLLNAKFHKENVLVKYSLFSPRFLREETLVVLLNYDPASEIQNIIGAEVFYPGSERVGFAHLSYANLFNINGTINASIPIANFDFIGCNFQVLTNIKQNRRFIEVFSPNNTAILESAYSYHSERLDSSLEGILKLEVPLSTRHIALLSYGYKKRPQITNGYSELTYNTKKILQGQYTSKSESRAGFEKDHIEITIQNTYRPLGIVYTNQYEYSAGYQGTNYPTVEFKQVNVYSLNNRTAFNIAGECRIKTSDIGQDIHLKAIHANRTVHLQADYKVLPGEFDQKSSLSLAENEWIAYRLNIVNKTTEEIDNQFILVNLAYPKRNFTLDGSYKVSESELSSEAKLQWDHDTERPRSIATAFQWANVLSSTGTSEQHAVLSFTHPSFSKDVTLRGKLGKTDERDLVNAALTLDYSQSEEKLLQLSGVLRDDSEGPLERKYSYSISGKHPSTRLDLAVSGHLRKYSSVLLETENLAHYKRSFLPVENGQLKARLDTRDYEIELHRENNELVKYLSARYYPTYPVYVLNGSLINTPYVNATGAFYLDIQEKLTWLMLNFTPDALESLRMHGSIGDARSAVFDIWRTYDKDFSISDVSFYLRLNHSRLVTSTLRWRPDLRQDVTNTIKTTMSNLYEGIGHDADYWKQYIKSETVSAISDIWDDAQEDVEAFVEDWDDLKKLEGDFEDLKIYLNNSYNANEFYIKDIAFIVVYVIDELSLRSHIESLPNILNEIWEIMGESGEAIRNSLLWIIETVKNGFNKISEVIAAILKGDSVSQIAAIVEKLVEKYDMFVKDLHVSFIKYVENLWSKLSFGLSQQWHKFLKLVEPLFIQVIHYLETVVWKASKEILDFLYDRRNELMTSPYFDRFTNFTQDVDKIYKDIKANDIVTNIHKYSSILIQFLTERYFTVVPFGKELKDVVNEILSGVQELKNLPSVNYAFKKMEQLYEKARYLYEYLDVRLKIESTIRLVHSKLMDISLTALEAENRYREAKTKFIFDPQEGLMCLEQKLPMSWHAFNQTPEFQEIPEYRAIADMGSYFTTSNTTFWTLYYRYKPYTEPTNWLPPFRAQAMIVGSQHFVTFDERHYDFVGSCRYLLARDFVHNHFAIFIEYDDNNKNISELASTYRLVVLIGEQAIELDIFKDTVKLLNSDTVLQLPVELEHGQAFVYQEGNIVIVEGRKNQFKLECNFKYDLCTLELSGWYHGKTAGLLGTMDNEKATDRLASDGRLLQDVEEFTRSWSLNQELSKCTIHKDFTISLNEDEDKESNKRNKSKSQICEDLFVNKTSELSSCFNVVDAGPYAEACMHSNTNDGNACTLAMAYMQACAFFDTYLRIPDKCTKCTMTNGSEVPEGEFRKLDGDSVPRSTDVVFIVEAKECNRDIKTNRSIEQLVTQLNKEFNEQRLTDNRWALVVFGGDGVYDKPRSIVLDSSPFTTRVARFPDYFQRIPIGDGSDDVFAAIGFASQLVFRAGVSKTFILMPCTHCDPRNQTLDFSVLHQVLLEHDITLHILMDGNFQFEKERLNKIFYGLDATKSYTKKDARILTGDTDLRRQVKLPKSVLGYCTPLSLETNGTIFSGNKLRSDKIGPLKKFASVFSKRVALSASPSPCQHCECIANNDGVTKMECMPCVYPTPVTVDYESFNEDEALSVLQPMEEDYAQIDMEDD
ncbi:uncharacterized protein LOC107269849 [Cephus cinctus]|uniref:Uncharacterized protein LOC107269849 n=1 Tax=Cephus cinctus TaxID=211228 RepID=A0AAJ7FMW3_CEPCN|nr:uncharacterized protein LOC107269849 [Cephus cinctus]